MYKGRKFYNDTKFWVFVFMAIGLAFLFPLAQYFGWIDWMSLLEDLN